ncbi:hypothetical protein [Gimesia maris]|uniref:hypothetical protein n=1 Tax=Gimesia maris TaxID=122 RepID=UPI003A8E5FB0
MIDACSSLVPDSQSNKLRVDTLRSTPAPISTRFTPISRQYRPVSPYQFPLFTVRFLLNADTMIELPLAKTKAEK